MIHKRIISTLILLTCALSAVDRANGSASAASQTIEQKPEAATDPVAPPAKAADDRTAVENTIRDAIGWAITKDRTRLESILAHDPDFFIFHPDSKTTVRGYDSFAKLIPGFMDPRFVATHFETKDLRPVFSRSGDVAWFSAMLEDCGTWMGKESCWKETRWTGVLEKRDGRWLIVQMHFSFAKDKVLADCPKAGTTEGSAAGKQ